MSVCLLAGVVIYCDRVQRFFSKFIDIYRPCQQQNLLALSSHSASRSGDGDGFSAAITAAVIPLFIGWAIDTDGRSYSLQTLLVALSSSMLQRIRRLRVC